MLKLGYTHSGGQAVGYLKLTEGGGNSFDGDLTFGVPYNKGSGQFGTRDPMTIKFNGYVGIGTNIPSSIFDVQMSEKSGINFTNSGNNSVLDFRSNEVESCGRIRVDESSGGGYMDFYTKTTGGAITKRLSLDNDGAVSIGGDAKANSLTVIGPSASQSGAWGGTITDSVAMFYGGKRTTIATNNYIDAAIVHIKGQINDNDTNSTGTHSTGKIVFSGRRATGAQSIIESATTWNRSTQNAGSELRLYTAPESNNGGTAAVERIRIKSNGNIVLGSDATNSEITFAQDGTSGTILYSTTAGFGGYNTLTLNSASLVHKYGGNTRFTIDSSGNTTTHTGNVGIHTATLTDNRLVGPASGISSFRGAYLADGMMVFNDTLNNSQGYYIGPGLNALNAGPVTLLQEMTVDGTWVIV